jgi:hypothetical protein
MRNLSGIERGGRRAEILAPGSSYGRWQFVDLTSESWLDKQTLTFEYRPTFWELLQGKSGTLRVVMLRMYLADQGNWESECFEAACDWIDHHSAQVIAQWKPGLSGQETISLPPEWTTIKFVRDGQIREIDPATIVRFEQTHVRECEFLVGVTPYWEVTLQDGTFVKLNLTEVAAAYPEIAERHRKDYMLSALSHPDWTHRRKSPN